MYLLTTICFKSHGNKGEFGIARFIYNLQIQRIHLTYYLFVCQANFKSFYGNLFDLKKTLIMKIKQFFKTNAMAIVAILLA